LSKFLPTPVVKEPLSQDLYKTTLFDKEPEIFVFSSVYYVGSISEESFWIFWFLLMLNHFVSASMSISFDE